MNPFAFIWISWTRSISIISFWLIVKLKKKHILFSKGLCLLSLGTFRFKRGCIYSYLIFLDYNDYITNYSSSVDGKKDLIGISTINSPYAWCINASNTVFNITLNQVSYITGISFQGDSNSGSFIRKFRIKYLQKGSWEAIHEVWYFFSCICLWTKCSNWLFAWFSIKVWKSSWNILK